MQKVFEYSSGHLPTIIKDEAKVVESYGGTIIFTPGDVVYSSTELLNLSQPKIENYKLTSLMERHKVTFKLIKDTLKK